MKIIGHRGAMGLEPENTLRAIKRGLNIGVDMVEFDIYVIKTGEAVLMHDDDVDRTTSGSGNVWDFTFKDLRELDAGKGEKVPTLEEALDLINHQVPVNIELKGPGTAEPVKKIISRYLRRGWHKSDFLVSSFNHQELRKFKEIYEEIDIAVLLSVEHWLSLLGSARKAVALAEEMDAAAINPDLKFVSQRLIDRTHEAGMAVNVFTLVKNEDVLRMRDMGVDGVFCNYPDRAKQVLKA